jgi:hypothetical protein
MNPQPDTSCSKASRFTVCDFCASSRLISFSQIQIQNSEVKNWMPLTSSRAIAIPAKRQASHLPEPQQPSRVVKVRQASQKNVPSSLDVKALLPPRHNQTTVKARKGFIFDLRKTVSLNPPQNHFVAESFCRSVPVSPPFAFSFVIRGQKIRPEFCAFCAFLRLRSGPISGPICGEKSYLWFSDGLLKTKSHKPPQSCHKVILTLTNHNKAIQTSKKNRQTNFVHKPSPRSAAVTAAGTSGVPPRPHQIQNQNSKIQNGKSLLPRFTSC